MTNPSNSAVQNLLPVQAYFNLDGSFSTFIGQGVPFTATISPDQSGLNITNSTINSTTIGATTPSTGVFTNIATTTGTISTQPTGATDIVNLLALQSYAAGISWKQPCAVATLANITLSGLQTIDGYTTLAGDRVLVKNQSTAANNGIYLASATAWTRSLDADAWQEFVSAITFIEYGTQAGGAWFCTATPGGTLGVTALNWSQFTTSATYSAGTGLTLTGTVFSITPVGTANTYGSATQTPVFTTNASGQVTAVTNTTITPAVGSITGLGTNVATALAVNVGSAGAFVVNGGVLGTPSSGTVTNLTGTASISINGSVGSTTPNPGAFTYLSTSSVTSTTPVLSFNASNTSFASGATIASSYLQFLIQNKSGTAGASTNYVLSNDLGTDSTYYGEFGMNSSVFSASTPADFFSINNGVYFSAHDGDVSVGSGNGGKHYLVWGTTGQSAHVINVAGAIGLNTNLGTTPALSGTTNFGTAGQVLTSQGSASTPTWVTPNAGTVTSVTGTSPVVSSGGATPAISMPVATTSVNGYLSSTDWTTFNGKQATLVSGTNIKTVNGTSLLGTGDLGTITVPYGGTGLTSLTANYIPYGNGASAFSSSANLTFNGTTLTTANDASISGLTVGKGGGAVAGNTAFGLNALAATATGAANTGVGQQALNAVTSGAENSAYGLQAMLGNTTGGQNTALGTYALKSNTTASNNTAVGYQAGYSNTTGTANAFCGAYAGYSSVSNSYCTFIGEYAGYATTGVTNTFVGQASGYLVTSGTNNTILGTYSGNQGGLDIRTANNYIVLSDGAGNPRGIFDSSGNLLVGTTTNTTNTKATFSYDGNSVNGMGIIDSTGTTAGTRYSMFFQRGTGTTVGSISTTTTLTSYNISSDRRLKENVFPLTNGLSSVLALKPSQYNYISDPNTQIQGFIADELQQVIPHAVTGEANAVDEEGNPIYQGVDASFLVPHLVSAIQEQQALITTMQAKLKDAGILGF